MKFFFKIILLSTVLLILGYGGYIFFCNQHQVEIGKQGFITFLFNRELEFRKSYAEAQGKGFSLTALEKQDFSKEEKKFYSYCSSNNINEHCSITTNMNFVWREDYTKLYKILKVNIQYTFDDESKKFFNTVKTYYGENGRNAHFESKVYQGEISGWNLELEFWDCEENFLDYIEEKIKVDNKLVDKESLVNIKSQSRINGLKLSDGFDVFVKL